MAIRFVAALTALVMLSACGGRTQWGSPGGSITISGRVYSTGTGQPLAGASVGSQGQIATTAADGSYSLTNLSAIGPTISITASKAGFIDSTVAKEVGGRAITQNFYLTPTSNAAGDRRVSGRVDFAAPSSWSSSVSLMADAIQPARPTRRARSVIVYPSEELTGDGAAALAVSLGAVAYRAYPESGFLVLQPPEGTTVEAFVTEVLQHPDVVFAEVDSPMSLSAAPTDPLWSLNNYPHRLINLPAVWDVTTGSQTVTVAVLDTGIRDDHPDLAGRVVPGYDYVDGDQFPIDPGNPTDPKSSHGTHVAGIIGALANNGQGTAGVAWDVRILNVRVIDNQGDGDTSHVAAGIRYAADNGADIINMSLGTDKPSLTLQQAVEYADSKGVVMVAASGNYSDYGILCPACYPEVIAVGSAVSPTVTSSFNNYGPGLDLLAPGSSILSTNYNRPANTFDYQTMSGTSMAAAHVSGVAALMVAAGIPKYEVADILRRTATMSTVQESWTETRGYGLVNAYAAVMDAKINETRIFLVDAETVVSAVLNPGQDRRFVFEGVPASPALDVVAWLDINDSATLDDTDMTAIRPLSTATGDVGNLYMPLAVHQEQSSVDQFKIRQALAKIGVLEE